jgi:hypothetical protein
MVGAGQPMHRFDENGECQAVAGDLADSLAGRRPADGINGASRARDDNAGATTQM